jgi:outer membrane receptor protein involved in Fe transport
MACALVLLPGSAGAQQGFIEGRVRVGVRGIRHVTAEVIELGALTVTGADGRYRFDVPPGAYTVSLRLGGFEVVERAVVAAGAGVRLDTVVDWPVLYAETMTVVAPVRFPERALDASAAVTTLSEADLDVQASHGQLPRLFAFTPGIELTQSGLFDYNVNARGFNTAVNRHVKTMIDGRDPSVPVLLGYQDWAANSLPLDDIEHAEFIRGPGAALYGAGAFNGILNVTTSVPRDTPGGFVRLTIGGLDTRRVEVRHAGRVTGETYFKISGGYHRSADFTRARVDGVEYAPGVLPQEVLAPPRDRVAIAFGSARVDRYFGPGRVLEAEFGASHVKGLTTVTSAGRTQAQDTRRPWARARFTTPSWTVSTFYTGQTAEDQMGLSTGAPVFLRGFNLETEVVGHRSILNGRGRVSGGASAGWQRVDSADRDGRQTVFSARQRVDRWASFGQIEHRFSDRLRAVVSGRWDDSDLHDGQLSPRASVLFGLTPYQNLHLSVSRAFQSPSVTEFYLSTPVAPAVDLSALEAGLAPLLGGVSLGFGAVPVLAAGNERLDVEKVTGLEVGYGGVVGRRAYVTLNYYRNRVKDFTSNLLPQIGTPLGRINPAFGPYEPPSALGAPAAATVRGALAEALPAELFAQLSNDATGAPVFVVLSFRNIGEATTQGVEAGVNYVPLAGWRLDASYTFFDYEMRGDLSSAFISPNTPAHQWSAMALYGGARVSGSFRYRWVDGFSWASGLFTGPVPSYGVADLQGLYALTAAVRIGVDVSNVFARSHYELFGGDLLERRAVASVEYSW